jgi:hypothetical protein
MSDNFQDSTAIEQNIWNYCLLSSLKPEMLV